MTHSLQSKQRGISFFGLIFVIAVLACVGVVAVQAFPTVLEYQAIVKGAHKAAQANTVAEIRAAFDRAAQIDDIKSISGKDLEISKNGDKNVVKFAYTREIHMFGPAYLLLKYSGTASPNTR